MSEEPSQGETGSHLAKATNPLSEETRKERMYLLGMSAIGITIVFTGLIPTEIRTLGITFAEADRTSLLLIFALVVAYFLAAFVSYALSDYIAWVSAMRNLNPGTMRRDFGFAGPIITFRFAFEFILPPIVGAFAIAVLLIKAL